MRDDQRKLWRERENELVRECEKEKISRKPLKTKGIFVNPLRGKRKNKGLILLGYKLIMDSESGSILQFAL